MDGTLNRLPRLNPFGVERLHADWSNVGLTAVFLLLCNRTKRDHEPIMLKRQGWQKIKCPLLPEEHNSVVIEGTDPLPQIAEPLISWYGSVWLALDLHAQEEIGTFQTVDHIVKLTLPLFGSLLGVSCLCCDDCLKHNRSTIRRSGRKIRLLGSSSFSMNLNAMTGPQENLVYVKLEHCCKELVVISRLHPIA